MDLTPPEQGIDPAVKLLVAEIRRGQDGLLVEMRAIRSTNAWLTTSVVTLAIISVFGLMSSRGVDVREVAAATAAVMPETPVAAP